MGDRTRDANGCSVVVVFVFLLGGDWNKCVAAVVSRSGLAASFGGGVFDAKGPLSCLLFLTDESGDGLLDGNGY